MTDFDEDRKYILRSHLVDISHIADIKYQYRVWMCAKGPECDDFTETVCHFFDTGDPMLDHYQDYNLTNDQYWILKAFRDIFETFSDQYSSAFEFIDTPEWAVIRAEARKVLAAFNFSGQIYIKLTKSEYDYLETASFVPRPIFLAEETGEHMLIALEDEADALRNLCQQHLKQAGYDCYRKLISEGMLLNSLITTLKEKKEPSLIKNQLEVIASVMEELYGISNFHERNIE